MQYWMLLNQPGPDELVLRLSKALLWSLPNWLHTTQEYNPTSFCVTLWIVRYETCKLSLVVGSMVYFEFESMTVKFPKSMSSFESAEEILFHFIQSNWKTVCKLAWSFVCKQLNFATPCALTLLLIRPSLEILGTLSFFVPIKENW